VTISEAEPIEEPGGSAPDRRQSRDDGDRGGAPPRAIAFDEREGSLSSGVANRPRKEARMKEEAEIKLNTTYIRYNLEEARDEICELLGRMRNGTRITYEEFYDSMQSLIHHVNVAWNARVASPEETQDPPTTTFEKWGRFPTDITLM
jgi:hypothetical protein